MNTGQWICLVVFCIVMSLEFVKMKNEERINVNLYAIATAIMFLAFTIMKVGK